MKTETISSDESLAAPLNEIRDDKSDYESDIITTPRPISPVSDESLTPELKELEALTESIAIHFLDNDHCTTFAEWYQPFHLWYEKTYQTPFDRHDPSLFQKMVQFEMARHLALVSKEEYENQLIEKILEKSRQENVKRIIIKSGSIRQCFATDHHNSDGLASIAQGGATPSSFFRLKEITAKLQAKLAEKQALSDFDKDVIVEFDSRVIGDIALGEAGFTDKIVSRLIDPETGFFRKNILMLDQAKAFEAIKDLPCLKRVITDENRRLWQSESGVQLRKLRSSHPDIFKEAMLALVDPISQSFRSHVAKLNYEAIFNLVKDDLLDPSCTLEIFTERLNSCVWDATKTSLLYYNLHKAAQEYPDSKIHAFFYDDSGNYTHEEELIESPEGFIRKTQIVESPVYAHDFTGMNTPILTYCQRYFGSASGQTPYLPENVDLTGIQFTDELNVGIAGTPATERICEEIFKTSGIGPRDDQFIDQIEELLLQGKNLLIGRWSLLEKNPKSSMQLPYFTLSQQSAPLSKLFVSITTKLQELDKKYPKQHYFMINHKIEAELSKFFKHEQNIDATYLKFLDVLLNQANVDIEISQFLINLANDLVNKFHASACRHDNSARILVYDTFLENLMQMIIDEYDIISLNPTCIHSLLISFAEGSPKSSKQKLFDFNPYEAIRERTSSTEKNIFKIQHPG